MEGKSNSPDHGFACMNSSYNVDKKAQYKYAMSASVL
ncbi:hypothetical protein FOPG_19162 [Fusarium oxysporum f. sp. conglutinans race 2 54008]|uniref:Uncharacterized protein n=1 Tax=Fusarium oxysporum f. sp. conglutinans race 2 54008 TaxID=1089457 RepID=X0GLS5_FUSOX|nr:hypothetical protein FOPG_19162 [Fusarium oxysporum f. sp. conglutinans race 2 54008]